MLDLRLSVDVLEIEMPVGAQRPGLLTRLIQWVRMAFQAAQTHVPAPKTAGDKLAGDLPSLFTPRLAAVRAALAPVSLVPAIDFAATLRTFALAARLHSVATQNVRCSLKGRRKRRAAVAGKQIPKPVPRVLKRYSPGRLPVTPARRCGPCWSTHTAQVFALSDMAVRATLPDGGERRAA
jgi:hypothetical protein